MKTLLEDAEAIARITHDGQFRRDGKTPYITHIERVVYSLRNYSETLQIIAWLHDTIEDHPNCRDSIIKSFSEEISQGIIALTRTAPFDYEPYLANIKANYPYVIPVKIADMLDNLTDNPSDSQKERYKKSILYLASR